MAEIVNLRQARKRKARGAAREEGDRNAIQHGRTKTDRAREAAEADRVSRAFEGHRRDRAQDDHEAHEGDDEGGSP